MEKQYTEVQIAEALRLIDAGASIQSAAAAQGIPYHTLRHRFHGARPQKEAHEKAQRLLPEEESHLAKWVTIQAALGLPPTHGELRFFAEKILRTTGDSQPLGRHWVKAFLRRNPQIEVQRARRMENARVNGATTDIIQSWWPRLSVPEIASIPPKYRHNMDEGGLQEGRTGNGLTLGLAGTRALHRKEPGSRTWTSFTECVSADGHWLRPLIIFKGKHVQDQWFPSGEGSFNDWEFTATDNGWTNDRTGLEWLQKIYLPGTRPDPPQPRLLILDGHGSHVTKAFQYLCFQNNVYLLYLPAHSSHVLQPLDLGVFSPVKQAYRRGIDAQAQFCCSTVVGKRVFLTEYKAAREKGITSANIKAGWAASGLWPVRISKPLMSRLLLENSNQGPPGTSAVGTGQIRAPKTPTKVPRTCQRAWKTPTKSRELASQMEDFTSTIQAPPTKRLFLRKIRKGFTLKDLEIADYQRKISSLEAQLEAARPRKRKSLHPDPNETFLSGRQIYRQREGLEEAESISSESAEESDEGEVQDCIVVG
ncbi:hypothetical protein RB597_001529 [Gaeumannomyces tritici]